jgi:hypothetical protein
LARLQIAPFEGLLENTPMHVSTQPRQMNALAPITTSPMWTIELANDLDKGDVLHYHSIFPEM